MSTAALVVRPGDRVSATGVCLHREGEDWLDLSWVVPAVSPYRWQKARSIRPIGVDPDAWAQAFVKEPGLKHGCLRVRGVWDGAQTITVDSQERVRWQKTERSGIACPPPPDGWDTENVSRDVAALTALRTSGAVVHDSWIYIGGAFVLRVAATDVHRVRRELGGVLARRLCIVQSRYSVDEVRRVEEAFTAHRRDWGFEDSSTRATDADGQPYAHAFVGRVCEDLADWADSITDGLVRITARMVPA